MDLEQECILIHVLLIVVEQKEKKLLQLYKGLKSIRVHRAINMCGYTHKTDFFSIKYLFNFNKYINNIKINEKKKMILSSFFDHYYNNYNTQLTIIISKKILNKSVQRNRLRRQIKEALRLYINSSIKIFAKIYINIKIDWQSIITYIKELAEYLNNKYKKYTEIL